MPEDGRCCRCHGRHTGGQRLAGAPPGQETRIGTEEGSCPTPRRYPPYVFTEDTMEVTHENLKTIVKGSGLPRKVMECA